MWQSWWTASAGTPVLAFVTTLHCALTVLRRHRTPERPLALLPSCLLTISPWFFGAPFWLALGVAAHLSWYLACERLLPRSVARAEAEPVRSAPAPAATAHQTKRTHTVRLLAAFDETPEIRTFRFERPRGFDFKPGQFVIVRTEIDGRPLSRCYSICTPPSCSGHLEISVRRQGTVSRHLHAALAAGGELTFTGPGGAFVYPETARALVLLAGGIGITPLISMLRHALTAEPSRRVALILSARDAASVPFRDELAVLARRHPSFRLAITLTGGAPLPGYHAGRMDAELIRSVAGNPAACEFLICGPLPMIDASRQILETLGVPASQVHFEKFETAAAAAANDAVRAAANARVTFRMSRKIVDAGDSATILDLAEREGLTTIPSMCRAGVCGTCRTRLVEGRVEGDFDALDHSERSNGWILACTARAAGDCVVEA